MFRPGCQRGFTLIEILVALTVVAIVLSVTLLSVNLAGNDRELRTEGERLVALIEAARDDSVFQGREFGLEFVRGGYRFVEFDPESSQWSVVPGDEQLRFWPLPEPMELALRLEAKNIQLEAEPAEIVYDPRPGAPPSRFAPHVLIFSSGEMTPFQVTLTRPTERRSVTLSGDLLGNLELVESDDDNAL